MGGYNSGRRGWRSVIESRKRLDVRQCRTWLRPGHIGSYSWNQDGRADRLCERAGVEDEAGLVHKRKWMRWRTYHLLMDRAAELNAVADSAFVYRAMRLIGK